MPVYRPSFQPPLSIVHEFFFDMKNYFTSFAFFWLLVSLQPTFSQTPQWHYLGDTIIEETWISGILFHFEGDAPYVAYQTFNDTAFAWAIKRFDGNSWVPMDTVGLGLHNFHLLGTTASGVLQIVHFDHDSKRFVLKQLIGNTWQTVSESPQLSFYPYLGSYFFDKENFYAAFRDEDLDDKITVWKFDGSNWSTVGQAGFSEGAVHTIVLKVSNGIPWVAYEDWSLGSAGVVKKFDGNTWQSIGNQVFDGDPHDQMDFAVSNGIPYVAYADSTTQNRASVVKFDGATWSNVGPPMFTERTDFLKLAINADNQEPYLIFEDHGPSFWGLSAMRFDGNVWDYVGARGFINNYWSLEFVIKGGIPYVGHERSPFGGGASVQVFSPLSPSTEPQNPGISFSILPNPIANGMLQVQIDNPTNVDAICQIFDQNGRLLQEKNFQIRAGKVVHSFNVSDFKSGVYALRIQSNNGKEYGVKSFVVAQ